MEVNRKFVALVRDGITPRKIEQCKKSADIEVLAETHGWDKSDVKQFARHIVVGTIPQAVRK